MVAQILLERKAKIVPALQPSNHAGFAKTLAPYVTLRAPFGPLRKPIGPGVADLQGSHTPITEPQRLWEKL